MTAALVAAMRAYSPAAYFRLTRVPPPLGLLITAAICGAISLLPDTHPPTIVAAARSGTATTELMAPVWRFVLLLALMRGVRAWVVGIDLSRPGFAAVLPWLRERLQAGRLLAALGCAALSAAVFLWLHLPAQAFVAAATAFLVFTTIVAITDHFTDVPGAVLLLLTGLVILPHPLIIVATNAPLLAGAVGWIAAALLFRATFPTRAARQMAGAVAVDPDESRIERIAADSVRPDRAIDENSEPARWLDARGFVRWIRCSMEERGSTPRQLTRRVLLLGLWQGALGAAISTPLLVLLYLSTQEPTRWELSVNRLHPISRRERARYATIATTLWVALIFAVTVGFSLMVRSAYVSITGETLRVGTDRFLLHAAIGLAIGVPAIVFMTTRGQRGDYNAGSAERTVLIFALAFGALAIAVRFIGGKP